MYLFPLVSLSERQENFEGNFSMRLSDLGWKFWVGNFAVSATLAGLLTYCIFHLDKTGWLIVLILEIVFDMM